jgi:hypothetical protein
VLASDIVFIGLRDGRAAELAASLRRCAARCTALLFAFEERLCDEEQEFMEGLGLRAKAATRVGELQADATAAATGAAAMATTAVAAERPQPHGPLEVTELRGAAVALTYEQSLKGAGGHPDTELWNPQLFWEPPPIRMFVLRARRPQWEGCGDR